MAPRLRLLQLCYPGIKDILGHTLARVTKGSNLKQFEMIQVWRDCP